MTADELLVTSNNKKSDMVPACRYKFRKRIIHQFLNLSSPGKGYLKNKQHRPMIFGSDNELQ
jgi:hypothetical protein